MEFKHETTENGMDSLANKWYYKKCMAQKNANEWSGRRGHSLPSTEACYDTLWDATNARHYSWQVKFVKVN